jgi:hypothetical protein
MIASGRVLGLGLGLGLRFRFGRFGFGWLGFAEVRRLTAGKGYTLALWRLLDVHQGVGQGLAHLRVDEEVFRAIFLEYVVAVLGVVEGELVAVLGVHDSKGFSGSLFLVGQAFAQVARGPIGHSEDDGLPYESETELGLCYQRGLEDFSLEKQSLQ